MAMIGCEVIASFHLDAKMGPVACFSQNITKGVVVPPHHHHAYSGGMMSQRVKGIARAKCILGSLGSVRTKPPVAFRLNLQRVNHLKEVDHS